MHICIYILCRKSPGPSRKVSMWVSGPIGPMGPNGTRAQMGPRPNWANGPKWVPGPIELFCLISSWIVVCLEIVNNLMSGTILNILDFYENVENRILSIVICFRMIFWRWCNKFFWFSTCFEQIVKILRCSWVKAWKIINLMFFRAWWPSRKMRLVNRCRLAPEFAFLKTKTYPW